MHADIDRRVVKVVADVLGVASADVASTPALAGDWESVQGLTIALSIEQEFGLELQPEEMEKMTSVSAIIGVIAARGASAQR